MSRPEASLGKLDAYLARTDQDWEIARDAGILYLGAAQGTSAQAMADRIPEGTLVAVEKSPVAALGLVAKAREQGNLVPVLADAGQPQAYDPFVPPLDLVYQDLAQPDQVEIFCTNVEAFRPRRGFLAVKAASVAVDQDPEAIFERAGEQVAEHGELVDIVRLDPHHKDHAMIVADFQGA